MKAWKKILIIVIILAVLVGAYMIWQRTTVDLTRAQAMDIAVAHVGEGTAATPDLDWEIWRWLWSVEVWDGAVVHELYIHPRTGEVVRHEIDGRW